MLLSELFTKQLTEMPYAPADQDGNHAVMKSDISSLVHFYSNATLADEFILIKQDPAYSVYINKEHTMAVIGEMGNRPPNNVEGMYVFVTLDFKDAQDISNSNPSASLKGALQVDLVVANNTASLRRGFGTAIYWALADRGITIISDNTQYKGGKELWKKLAREQGSKYVINVIRDGVPLLDDNGQPFVYNGSNIPDDDLWSARPPERTRRAGAPEPAPDVRAYMYHTLFTLRAR